MTKRKREKLSPGSLAFEECVEALLKTKPTRKRPSRKPPRKQAKPK